MEIAEGMAVEELALRLAGDLEQVLGLFRSLVQPSALSMTACATLSTLECNGPCRLTALAARERPRIHSETGSTAAFPVSDGCGVVVWIPLDVCGFRFVLARDCHGAQSDGTGVRPAAQTGLPVRTRV